VCVLYELKGKKQRACVLYELKGGELGKNLNSKRAAKLEWTQSVHGCTFEGGGGLSNHGSERRKTTFGQYQAAALAMLERRKAGARSRNMLSRVHLEVLETYLPERGVILGTRCRLLGCKLLRTAEAGEACMSTGEGSQYVLAMLRLVRSPVTGAGGSSGIDPAR
jgi:hypothetical protein